MREIKFRAWVDNKMVQWESLLDNKLWIFNNASGLWIFMQYTGLKDKNGKEIYEGDIIRYESTEDFDAQSTYEEVAEVIFETGAFSPVYLMERDLHSYDDALMIVQKVEIIGNIYENPELLEEKKS